MSTYDETGIVMDPYADVKSGMDDAAKDVWGESINLAPDSYLGHDIELNAQLHGSANQIVQDVYDSFRVTGASGTPLDSLVALVGLERQAAAYSTVTLSLTASVPTTVAAGSIYATLSGVRFATDSDLVFAAAGTDTVAATCTEVGENNAAAGEIDQQITTTYGITAVTNAAAAVPGRIRETDPELRARHSTAVSTSGDNDSASIYEAVSAVTGVSSVYIDNDTHNGRVGVSVIGGSDDDVATAIYNNLTVGVATYGTSSVDVYDETTRQITTIYFTRASNVDTYITMTITTVSGLFPDDGQTQIKTAISTFYDGLEINDDVVHNSLFAPIYSIDGVTVNSLFIDVTASPTGTSNIEIDIDERAVIDTNDIIVLVQ